jgi:hypothetical protein
MSGTTADGVGGQRTPPEPLLDAVTNMTRFHREHEKFYAQAPLRQALEIQAASRALKALADQWSQVEPSERPIATAFAGSEDLNAPGLTAESGILFMESEGEPAEIKRLKRDLEAIATDNEETGTWLSAAMEQAWAVAGRLSAYAALADLLGERHRIIATDWQNANDATLVARLVRRALELLTRIDFSPQALRADLAGSRDSASYLYSASELLDRAADVLAESAIRIHENERRWRIFGERVRALRADAAPVGEPRPAADTDT